MPQTSTKDCVKPPYIIVQILEKCPDFEVWNVNCFNINTKLKAFVFLTVGINPRVNGE